MANKTAGGSFGWRRHAGTAGVAAIAAVFGLAAALVVSGRERPSSPGPIISNTGQTGADPALANLANPAGLTHAAPFSGPVFLSGTRAPGQANAVRVLSASASYAPQSSGETYPPGQQAPAPIVRGNNASQNESLQYNTQPPAYNGSPSGSTPNNSGSPNYSDPNASQNFSGTNPNSVDPNAPDFDNQGYADATSQENAGYEALEQADQAPPPLPEYDQPPAPDDNYLWTPGYWGYSTGYYWVPGAWVAPPFYGALWTPPWWGSYGGRYRFHRGYWGTHIGFYGGINYGYGYVGSGFYGGYWQGRSFYYNRAVTNVNIARVHNVYQRDVVINNVIHNGSPLNRTSFNGPGGVRMQPRPFEVAATREAHYAPVPAQVQVRQTAASNRGQFYMQNHGRPAQAFDQRPLGSGSGIANTPQIPQSSQRAEQNHQQYGQGQAARGVQANQPGYTRGDQPGSQLSNRPGNQLGSQPGYTQGNQPGIVRAQPGTSEVNRPTAPTPGPGGSRNDLIQQRTGLWNGERERNLQTGQQNQQLGRSVDSQQPQRDAAEQQRNLQLQQQRGAQQQQQRDADAQSQRDGQLGQQQQRNLQFQQQQQQRQAADQQQRNLQFQQQQQQRQAADQQQRNQQFQQQQQQRQAVDQQQRSLQFQQQQQQRQAVDQQQRSQQFQQQQQQRAVEQQQRPTQQQPQPQRFQPQPQPQHVEARPAPVQQQSQPHAAPPGGGGMHGRPQ